MKKILSALVIGLLSASAFADFPPIFDRPGDRDHGDRFGRVLCVARNYSSRDSRNYVGVGRNRFEASRNALHNCQRSSRDRFARCHVVGCRPSR